MGMIQMLMFKTRAELRWPITFFNKTITKSSTGHAAETVGEQVYQCDAGVLTTKMADYLNNDNENRSQDGLTIGFIFDPDFIPTTSMIVQFNGDFYNVKKVSIDYDQCQFNSVYVVKMK